jgi:hypothetical protein
MLPLDKAFMGPLKTFYCQEIKKLLHSNLGQVITIYQIGKQFGNAYKPAARSENVALASRQQAVFLVTRTSSDHMISL